MSDVSHEEKHYDYIVVGAGSAGSVLAAELSASGAQVLVIESGGPDDAPTLMNPSIWFYNVGGSLDYQLPIRPSPQLNNRNLKMPPVMYLVAAAASTPWYGRGACHVTSTGGLRAELRA